VFVSSITGYTPFVGLGAYGVTKTALLGLTKALAQSLAHRGIRVNAIAPGVIRTDFSKALWDNPTPETEQGLRSMIPLGRLGEPDDCAGTVSFLVSEDAKYITGETIMITGGIAARL
jgi:dehydrogenase/reductase SDR family protein 4